MWSCTLHMLVVTYLNNLGTHPTYNICYTKKWPNQNSMNIILKANWHPVTQFLCRVHDFFSSTPLRFRQPGNTQCFSVLKTVCPQSTLSHSLSLSLLSTQTTDLGISYTEINLPTRYLSNHINCICSCKSTVVGDDRCCYYLLENGKKK